MTRSKKVLDKLIDEHYAVQRKKRLNKVLRTLAEIGIFAAASVGSASAEPVYYYTGNSETEAATDEEKWQEADGNPVQGIIVKTEGNANEYRFLPGVYDGKAINGEVWLIGEKNDVYIVSDGPLTLQNWGMDAMFPAAKGMITTDGKIIFGDDVSILNNRSGASATKGGGALYAKKGIVFGDNARITGNVTAVPIGGSSYGGGAIFLDATTDSELSFGKNALIEKNEASMGGALYVIGSVNIGEGANIRENIASSLGSSQGGALYVRGKLTMNAGSLVESNKTVTSSTASTYGGAFFFDGGSANILGTTFRNNKTSSPGFGGAIYIQEGSLFLSDGTLLEGNEATYGGAVGTNKTNIDLKNTYLKNNNATNGGALFLSNSSVTTQDENKDNAITGTVFEGNRAVTSGGAIYAQTSSAITLGNGTRFENNQATKGGAVYATASSRIDINNTAFNKNSATYGGAFYVANSTLAVLGNSSEETVTGTTFNNNTASSYGGAIYASNSTVSTGRGTVFEGNQANGMGGAIAQVQGTLNLTDNVFKNNSSSQAGGAMFLQNTSLDFNVTQTSATPAISGNTSALGGFLYSTNSTSTFDIDQGQQLQIGDANYSGTDTNIDSIYIDSTSSITKKGGGELKINSSMNNIWGTVSVEDGTIAVGHNWNIRNTVSLTGGTLDMPSFSFVGDKSRLVIAGGALLTNTHQIFGTGLNSEGSNQTPVGLKDQVNEHMDFSSGLISFNDTRYNLQYASSAARILDAGYEGNGLSSNREIIFTGNLYTAAEPDPIPGPSGSVSIDDLNGNHVNNVVLGNVTITTTTGTDTSGKNLIIGAPQVDDSTFADAQAIAGSIGGRNLNLGTDGSGVTIAGGHYLTLVGGSSDTSLVQAGNDGNKPVDLFVGSTLNGRNSAGILNLGTTAMDSGGVLTGNIQVSDSSVLNVRAGEYRITGESTTAGEQTVPGINNNGGTLNIAEQASLQASLKQTGGETNVSGTLASSSVELENGRLNVSGTARMGQLTQHNGETAVSGKLETASLEATGGKMSVTGALKAETLVATSGVTISVGDKTAAGKLSSSSASLDGGEIFLDPVWLGNDTVETASHGALVFNNQTVDGLLTVGRNSLLVLGDTSPDQSIRIFNASGLKWGKDNISAALSITSPQYLSSTKGAIMVDGSLESPSALTPNSATFNNGSLLVVDTSRLNGNAAITAENGVLTVAENASLLLGNVTAGKHVITSGFTDNTGVKGWDGNLLSSSDQLISLSLDKTDSGTVKVEATVQDVKSTLPGIVMPGITTEIWHHGLNNTNSSNAGIAFLSRTMDSRYLAPNDTVRTINGAAQMAIATGVQASAIAASDSVNRALQDHLSLNNNINQRGAPSLHREGADLWASMLYRDSDSSGIRAGDFNADYKNNFGGILAGADYTWKDTGNGSFRAGSAVNIGKGDGKSRGDFNDTRNDYDTYGLSAYGSWNSGNANLMVDIGYMKGKNELKQTVPSTLGNTLKADLDTQIWTIGAQGEYRLKTAAFDLTPHIGVRWLRLKTDAFQTHNSRGTVFQTGSDTQNIWQIPVGITLSRDYVAKNGWTVKPKLDISFIPATGDRNASTRIHVPGVAANDITRTEILDSSSWNGSLGLDMQKDRMHIGIRAAYQKSGNEKSRGAMLTINRQFD